MFILLYFCCLLFDVLLVLSECQIQSGCKKIRLKDQGVQSGKLEHSQKKVITNLLKQKFASDTSLAHELKATKNWKKYL